MSNVVELVSGGGVAVYVLVNVVMMGGVGYDVGVRAC